MTDPSPHELTTDELSDISDALGNFERILDAARLPPSEDQAAELRTELRRLRTKTASLAFNKVSG